MSLGIAIKRSYRYFIPPSLLNPRQLVRQLCVPLFFYVMGLQSGSYHGVETTSVEHYRAGCMIAIVILLVLGWWAGVDADKPSKAI